jgi:cytidylate kinase
MNKITIAIDGHSACGKSTTAKAVAKSLGYIYIDTGAMYRAVTLFFMRNNVDMTDSDSVLKALNQISIHFSYSASDGSLHTILNDEDVEQEIRKPEIANEVSKVSAISQVRRFLVAQQQQMGAAKGVVMDGRDIGTVVFPVAELKIFMTASPDIRAERRMQELQAKGLMQDFEQVKANLLERDLLDSTREDSPLKQADDAVVIDTSFLTMDQQAEKVVELAKERIKKS